MYTIVFNTDVLQKQRKQYKPIFLIKSEILIFL